MGQVDIQVITHLPRKLRLAKEAIGQGFRFLSRLIDEWNPGSKRQHVGQKMVNALVAHAALRFQNLCLFTDTAAGDAFYLKCGFMRTDYDHATHVMCLSNS
nr:hypothetical protein [Pseudomonas sp. PS02290]